MSLSKPVMNLFMSYIQNLYTKPIRTKSITSNHYVLSIFLSANFSVGQNYCYSLGLVIASSGNLASQLIAGGKINVDSVIAFGLFGLLFGGSVPHYFYTFLGRTFPTSEVKFALAKQLLFERLIYAPLFQLFSLYTLSRFEGKDHNTAIRQITLIYWPILQANWKWLTIFQVVNLAFVPPVLRVLFVNLVGFFWVMFLATKRRQQNEAKKSDQ